MNPCGILGFFLAGRVYQLQARKSEAEAAYRRALEVIPGTQSASTALAALLFTSGKRGEAAALIHQTLASPADNSDPWVDFQQGVRSSGPI